MDAGVDSLAASELAGRLAADLGLEIARALVFDHPTLADVERFVAGARAAEPSAEPSAEVAPPAKASRTCGLGLPAARLANARLVNGESAEHDAACYEAGGDETVASVAARFGLPVAELIAFNKARAVMSHCAARLDARVHAAID